MYEEDEHSKSVYSAHNATVPDFVLCSI